MRLRWRWAATAAGVVMLAACGQAPAPAPAPADPGPKAPPVMSAADLAGGSYRIDRGGWIFVHLQGAPSQIGVGICACSAATKARTFSAAGP